MPMLDQLRRWAIRKLGGFDEINRPLTVQVYRPRVELLRVSCAITGLEAELFSPEDLGRIVRARLTDKMAKELTGSNLMRLSKEYDPVRQEYAYTGRMYVARPEEDQL